MVLQALADLSVVTSIWWRYFLCDFFRSLKNKKTFHNSAIVLEPDLTVCAHILLVKVNSSNTLFTYDFMLHFNFVAYVRCFVENIDKKFSEIAYNLFSLALFACNAFNIQSPFLHVA